MSGPESNEAETQAIRDLIEALEKHQVVLERSIAENSNWKMRLRLGIFQGLGTVLGATVVVSITIWLLGLATQWDPVKPVAERIIQELRQEGPAPEPNE
ncbi:MAG: hypothetical protein KF812_05225 [Fimbriimonadaceae bacterium]|nr:hypothetical protein [Fimbriimonadaceae bacterium]